MGSERGRPRGFNEDEVLESAVQVFWRHGYHGASMSELTAAMGLNKPSLYAAFGGKEPLYLRALQRYLDGWLAARAEALEATPQALPALRAYLRALADMYTDVGLPGGCFVVTGTADAGGVAPQAIQDALRQAVQGSQAQLRRRIERALADGQLPVGAAPADLAAFYQCVLSGLAVLAKSGAGRAALEAVIEVALAAWPSR